MPHESARDAFGTLAAKAVRVKFADLRDRTFAFALSTIRLCRQLPATWEARRIAGQLFRAGTAVGANYRASRRARSDAEFIAKIGTVVEEADEVDYWLELLAEADIDRSAEREALAKEAGELRAIFVTSRKTAISNRAKRRQRQLR